MGPPLANILLSNQITDFHKLRRSMKLRFLPLMSSGCLFSVKKFSQRVSLFREVGKCKNKGKQSNESN